MNIFILSFRLPVCNTEYLFICACYPLFTSAFTDKEKLTAQIDALQAEAAEEPTVNTEALKQLKRTNFRGIYDGMEPGEKRRFWRAIIKVIWFDEERNINVEFL